MQAFASQFSGSRRDGREITSAGAHSVYDIKGNSFIVYKLADLKGEKRSTESPHAALSLSDIGST